MRRRYITALLLLAVWMAFATVGCQRSTSNQPNNPGENPPPPVVPEKPIVINADVLIAAAAKDKAATDQKYKGKTLIVGGVVDVSYTSPNPESPITRLVDWSKRGAILCTMKPVPKVVPTPAPVPKRTPPTINQDTRTVLVDLIRCRYDGVISDKPGATEIGLSDCEQYNESDRNKIFDELRQLPSPR